MEWIKCSERLPTKFEYIGCVSDGKNVWTDIYYDTARKVWITENGIESFEDVENITHWMLLADPPK